MVPYGMKPTPSLVSVPIEALPHQRRVSLRSARVGLVAPFCTYLRVRRMLNENADDADTGALGDCTGMSSEMNAEPATERVELTDA